MKHSHDVIKNIKEKLIRESSFNKIIIVIDYAKTKPTIRFSNHLNILEQCLNEVLDSSIIVIINRVNAKTPQFDLKRLRDEMRCCFKKRILKDFIFLEEYNNNLNENEQNNDVLDQMRLQRFLHANFSNESKLFDSILITKRSTSTFEHVLVLFS